MKEVLVATSDTKLQPVRTTHPGLITTRDSNNRVFKQDGGVIVIVTVHRILPIEIYKLYDTAGMNNRKP